MSQGMLLPCLFLHCLYSRWLCKKKCKLTCLCVVVSVDEGYLKNFFTKSANMSPKERADYLGEDEVCIAIVHYVTGKHGEPLPK
jgi:hypothetical protein